MKLGFNEATGMGCSDLETDIRLCWKAGFDYLEIRLDMLHDYLLTGTFDDLRSLLEKYPIKPHALNAVYIDSGLITSYQDSQLQLNELLAQFQHVCSEAKEIGSNYVIVVPPLEKTDFSTLFRIDWKTVCKKCTDILKWMSDIACRYSVNICFEPVGAPKSSVRSIAQANMIINLVNRLNVGFVLDAYNLYMYHMSSDYGDIATLPPEKIFAVHINNADAVKPSLEARRFCDSGVIDLGFFLSEIKKKNYQGMVSIETFRPEYWEMTPEIVINRAYQTTHEILEHYQCM
ncbi:MAG: sugar phosphate isomerase/epimerase [Spirochaetia bacterium]|jgi:2-keto-myo-inositol isomerase|nr:sugar phosphate isomerase/epimerase [Spirochaetia bacterium]